MIDVVTRRMDRIVIALMGASSLAAQAQDEPLPCKYDALFRQQDFTVGHWDVFADGKKIAEVRMEKVLNDCTLYETWTTMDSRPGNAVP